MECKIGVTKRLRRSVELFLKKHHRPGRPLLLGFSGGHDSRALFELLDLSRSRHKLDILVAHVDHGWRKESEEEAEKLQEMIESKGLPFFLHKLAILDHSNLEERCREERYAFFQRVYEKTDCQALLLGHQADDQVETFLKRLFEGAHFTALGAMRPFSKWGRMDIWRPLLEHSREEIIAFLTENGIRAIDDSSNYDPAFLRARMRVGLLPDLERAFGKNIRSNLADFAKSFQDLRDYFFEKSLNYLSESKENTFGTWLDFSAMSSLSFVEIEVAVKRFTQKEGIVLGTRHLRQLTGQLIRGISHKKLRLKKRLLIVDQKRLFVLPETYDGNLLEFNCQHPLK